MVDFIDIEVRLRGWLWFIKYWGGYMQTAKRIQAAVCKFFFVFYWNRSCFFESKKRKICATPFSFLTVSENSHFRYLCLHSTLIFTNFLLFNSETNMTSGLEFPMRKIFIFFGPLTVALVRHMSMCIHVSYWKKKKLFHMHRSLN